MATITETRQAEVGTDRYIAFETSVDYKTSDVSGYYDIQ